MNKYSYGKYLILAHPFRKRFMDYMGTKVFSSENSFYTEIFFDRLNDLCYKDKDFRFIVINWILDGGEEITEYIVKSISDENGERKNTLKIMNLIINLNKFINV